MSTEHIPAEIDPAVARYLADIAVALTPLQAVKVSYGEFYVARVVIEFDDGNETGYAVVPNEHGSLSIEVK